MRKTIIILGSVLCQLAYATPITNTTKATATLAASCTIRVDDFSFGDVNLFTTQFISNNIYVKCNKGVSYTLNGEERIVTGLFMKNANGEKLQYAVLTSPYNSWSTIFTKPGILSNGINGGSNIVGSGSGSENSHKIYLRAYGKDFGVGAPLPAPGYYSDSFQVSITY